MLILLNRMLKGGHRGHAFLMLAAVAAFVVIGGAVFAVTDHVAVMTGLYWAVTTATTVGYGDVVPHNTASRIVASAVMLTTIPLLAGAFALFTGGMVSSGLRKVLNMTTFPQDAYRVVAGDHPSVPAIVAELDHAGAAVVLVADVVTAEGDRVHLIQGDPTRAEVLRKAKPARADHLLVAGANDGDTLVIAVLLREQAPDVPITAVVHSPTVSEALRGIGVEQAMALDDLVAHTLAKSLETPHAGDLLSELVVSEHHRLTEVPVADAIVGRPLSQVRTERDGLVLGLVHDGRVSLGIGDDPTVMAGDCLLVAEPATREHQAAGLVERSAS